MPLYVGKTLKKGKRGELKFLGGEDVEGVLWLWEFVGMWKRD